MTVDEFDESHDAVESTTKSHGGCISDSNGYVNRRSSGIYCSGQLVVRAPFEDFSTLVADMEAPDGVEHIGTNSEDMADQLADIEARLSSLHARCDHLHSLYKSANTIEDVSAVEEHLTDVQTETERLEVQRQSLKNYIALLTTRVSLSE